MVPRPPYRPPTLAYRVFRGDDVLRLGILTRAQLRTSAWVRVRQNVYADSRLYKGHALACRAAVVALPSGAAIAGPSAAFLLGVGHAAGPASDVHVYPPLGARLGHHAGIRTHHARLDVGDLCAGVSVTMTSPLRTAWDLGRWMPPIESVPIIDGLLGIGRASASDLRRYAYDRIGERGARRAITAIDLADARAQSPPESVIRVRLVMAGIPKPVPQLPITVAGGLTLHPDLAWEEYRVALEYDGAWHASHEQLHRDRKRLNLLVGAGWIVLHVTSQRLRTDMTGIVAEVRAALTSRGWRPRSG